MIFLQGQGHAVTLTSNVATQNLFATCRLSMVIIFVKYSLKFRL